MGTPLDIWATGTLPHKWPPFYLSRAAFLWHEDTELEPRHLTFTQRLDYLARGYCYVFIAPEDLHKGLSYQICNGGASARRLELLWSGAAPERKSWHQEPQSLCCCDISQIYPNPPKLANSLSSKTAPSTYFSGVKKHYRDKLTSLSQINALSKISLEVTATSLVRSMFLVGSISWAEREIKMPPVTCQGSVIIHPSGVLLCTQTSRFPE